MTGASRHGGYQPPLPEVFGACDVELPPCKGFEDTVPPAGRMKLQDRLAMYEEDNPATLNWLYLLGWIVFPLWFVGAVMHCFTRNCKPLTLEAGRKNVKMSFVVLLLALIIMTFHSLFASSTSAETANPTLTDDVERHDQGTVIHPPFSSQPAAEVAPPSESHSGGEPSPNLPDATSPAGAPETKTEPAEDPLVP